MKGRKTGWKPKIKTGTVTVKPMKTGKPLSQIAAELERQNAGKRDFVAPGNALSVSEAGSLKVGDQGEFELSGYAHGQLATKLDIPRKHYDRLRADAPDLWAAEANRFLPSTGKHLIRTLDGKGRALLSDKYRTLDNYPLAMAVFPTLQAMGMTVESCDITESKFYIKALAWEKEFKAVGDIFKAGIIISNSEVGSGSLTFDPFMMKLACTNGMALNALRNRKVHLGRADGSFDQALEYFASDTRRADDAAFWLKTRDVMAGVLNDQTFSEAALKLDAAQADKIQPQHAVTVVEVSAKKFGLSEGEQSSVLTHLLSSGDLTRNGLIQAITRTAQDVEDYDRATELEYLGGNVLELPRSQWTAIVAQAAN